MATERRLAVPQAFDMSGLAVMSGASLPSPVPVPTGTRRTRRGLTITGHALFAAQQILS